MKRPRLPVLLPLLPLVPLAPLALLSGVLALVLLLPSCALVGGRHSINEQKEEIHISPLSRISWKTVQQVADARGGKQDGEIWHVDRHKGDIRISKSTGAHSRFFAPKTDVELWHKDEDGSWVMRTAE